MFDLLENQVCCSHHRSDLQISVEEESSSSFSRKEKGFESDGCSSVSSSSGSEESYYGRSSTKFLTPSYDDCPQSPHSPQSPGATTCWIDDFVTSCRYGNEQMVNELLQERKEAKRTNHQPLSYLQLYYILIVSDYLICNMIYIHKNTFQSHPSTKCNWHLSNVLLKPCVACSSQ